MRRQRVTSEPDPYAYGKRSYDIVKEGVIAFVVVALLTVVLAAIFSSPDEKPITVAQWANRAPADFVATALTELDGTSGVATYGPPYNNVAAEQIHALAQLYEGRRHGLGLALHAQIDVPTCVNAAALGVADARQAEHAHAGEILLDALHQWRQRRFGQFEHQ